MHRELTLCACSVIGVIGQRWWLRLECLPTRPWPPWIRRITSCGRGQTFPYTVGRSCSQNSSASLQGHTLEKQNYKVLTSTLFCTYRLRRFTMFIKTHRLTLVWITWNENITDLRWKEIPCLVYCISIFIMLSTRHLTLENSILLKILELLLHALYHESEPCVWQWSKLIAKSDHIHTNFRYMTVKHVHSQDSFLPTGF